MRRAVYISLLSLAIVIAGYGLIKRGGGTKKRTRPIVVILHQTKNGDCEAQFGKRPQHAFKGDEIAWEFINTCDSDQKVTLAIKSGSTNPFTDSAPWTISAAAGNAGSPAEKVLTVAESATGMYGFDIIVGGKTYDPRLEIDP